MQLKLGQAKPDHANIVFELQNQLDKHLLLKGLKVKDGKDEKQQDILFSLDHEIVVNKAQVAEVRTLFLKNEEVYDKTYLEGVYIGCGSKADGVEKDFKDGDPVNWYTLGNNYSKYTDPGKDSPKSYPNARLGFILASPVLFLNEGTRTVDITLACELKDSFCKDIADKCVPRTGIDCPEYPDFYSANAIYEEIQGLLEQTFYYISEDLIDEAVKNGLGTSLAQKIRENILEKTETNICGEEVAGKRNSALIQDADWTSASFTTPEITLSETFFKPRRVFKISFSGADGWIEPSSIVSLTLDPLILDPAAATPVLFTLHISVQLEIDKGAVTFYNKEKLKEDFNTTQPVVKIELDDVIKLKHDLSKDVLQKDCCLERDVIKENNIEEMSFYHFFRNVIIKEGSTVNVTVCGLKNFIVQNEENVQDVNAPIYPFGTRPKVIDFDAVNPNTSTSAVPNLNGPNFYLGNKEIFLKKWETLCVKLNWKDKPSDFNDYYKAYLERQIGNETVYGLNESDFLVRLALLQNGVWEGEVRKAEDEGGHVIEEEVYRPLFSNDACDICLPNTYDFSFFVNPSQFDVESKFIKSGEEFKNLGADTKYGFLRVTLRNQDFLHKDYASVLARQMMAITKYPKKDELGVNGAVYISESELTEFVPIPNQPWDPVISAMELDYTAIAQITDVDLIHLYPYEGTYKTEDIELEPSLFPVFCDEGTLFIGLKDLVPGSNLNILFQLAEATADSESEIEELQWYYLENNVWKELRKGFEILLDADGREATEGLTSSGIIKFAIPATITNDNTILPKDLYWIKASVAKNSKCISETIKIYTQAVSTTFTNTEANDKLRLSQPLVANSLSKLEVADTSIKTVLQPYDSFNGKVAEIEGHYYLRVSELLRHKGRAIQKWDYERIVLEEFQQVFKAKCITHSFKTDAHKFFNDVPFAPGYVLLAVIPDLTRLKAGNSFKPKAR